MNRIRITGLPGSGKTYLAPKLSELFNIPWFELDNEICFAPDDTNFTKKLPDEERQRRLKELVSKKKWILEGGFTSEWAKDSFEEAEVIVIIKPARTLRVFRVIRRSFGRWFKKGKKDSFVMFLRVIYWSWNCERKLSKVEKYPTKTITFKSADEAFEYFKTT